MHRCTICGERLAQRPLEVTCGPLSAHFDALERRLVIHEEIVASPGLVGTVATCLDYARSARFAGDRESITKILASLAAVLTLGANQGHEITIVSCAGEQRPWLDAITAWLRSPYEFAEREV